MSRSPATLDTGAESIFVGTYMPDDSRPISGERAMWLAVLARAWSDAFEASDAFLKQSEGKKSDPELIRGDARRWLVLDFGKWREDREFACDLAGIGPDVVRRAARIKLAQVKAGEQPTAEVINLDQMFSRLLDTEHSMSAAELDTALEQLAALECAA